MISPRLALAVASAFTLSAPAVAQEKIPVQFAKGTSSATVKGTIKGDQYRDYLVNARAGQTMTVTLANPDGRAFFNVLPPGSADEAVFVGSSSGNSFRGGVPGNGNTTIRVYQMRATARRGEVANYTLTIGVAGSASAAAQARSQDAMVPGTGFNATGPLRCVAEPDKPMVNCQAGVKRTGNGSGTVHVSTPDGGSRVITFANGRAVRVDSDARMTAERRGDMTIVRVGAYEVYEIPDMFIYGG
jgi:hypothetical protein